MKKINKITIVGGGTSGWMTAAALVNRFPDKDITLVESENIPTIGVGESTVQIFRQYTNIIGLADEEWMSKCNATYKLSIDFTNWAGDGKTVKYPFGKGTWLNKYKPIDWFIYKHDKTIKNHYSYVQFAMGHSELLRQEKFVHDDENLIGFDFNDMTGFQLDATLFANYLKNHYALPRGLNHIQDTIKDVIVDYDGNIKSLTSSNGTEYDADLFIDCTGFKSLLLGETLNTPFVSFEKYLLNDKAVATHIPYTDIEQEMVTSTDSYAHKNGWIWNVPLWTNIGKGYVYSSQFLTEEEAEKEFKEYLINNTKCSKEIINSLQYSHIQMTPGFHERSWVKNVCAIGLSNGFIEPLEATGLMFIGDAIEVLVDTLAARDGIVNSYDKSMFNNRVNHRAEYFVGFVIGHYAMATKNDTEYWKTITEDIDYLSIKETWTKYLHVYIPEFYDEHINKWQYLKPEDGTPYIMAGFGMNPVVDKVTRDGRYIENNLKIHHDIGQYIKSQEEYVSQFPSMYSYLKDNIYIND